MKKMKMSASNDQNLYLEIDVKKLDCPSSNLKPRREIGSYSLDIEKKVENSRRCLKYFIKPPNPENVNFDLKKGYDTRIIKPHGNDFHILSWMKENMDKFPRPDQDNQRNSEFVCRRGVIAKIMLTPYEEFEEWCVAVTLYKGTYYMQEIIPEKRRESDENLRDDEMACWGWKFEQYLTADRKDGKPNTDIPYNNCEAFYSVVETGIKNHSLVLCCEIDAIDTDDNYIELKITKEQSHEGHVKTFKRYKTKNWWAQCLLTGVEDIVCGFRDGNGFVKRLEFFKTEKLPNISNDIYNPWNPNVCKNFLDQFLSFVKSSIKIDDHKNVHTLKWKPTNRRIIECSPPLTNSEHSFLPQWYIDATS